jgi:hypothetical protein
MEREKYGGFQANGIRAAEETSSRELVHQDDGYRKFFYSPDKAPFATRPGCARCHRRIDCERAPAFRAKITGAQRFLASILRLTFIFDGLRRALPPYPPEVAESLGRRVSIPSRPPSAIGGLNNCKAMRRTTGTSLTVNSSSVFAIAVRIGFPGSASLVDLGFAKTGCTKRGNHELLSFTENRFYVIGSSQPVFHLDCASPFVFPQAIDAHCVGMLQRDSPDRTISRASFRGCRIS